MNLLLAIALAFAPEQERVSPEAASALQPLELSALVESLLPQERADQLAWTHGLDAPVVWITSGVEQVSPENYARYGLARVTVSGRKTTVLEQRLNELAWSVALQAETTPRFGPETIYIGPECLGSRLTGCTFTPSEALTRATLRVREVCSELRENGYGVAVFLVEAPEKRGYVKYTNDGGSGGSNAGLEISLTPADCEA